MGITSRLIMCFLRDLPESDALADTRTGAEPWLDALWLASGSTPPSSDIPQRNLRARSRRRVRSA